MKQPHKEQRELSRKSQLKHILDLSFAKSLLTNLQSLAKKFLLDFDAFLICCQNEGYSITDITRKYELNYE